MCQTFLVYISHLRYKIYIKNNYSLRNKYFNEGTVHIIKYEVEVFVKNLIIDKLNRL